MKIKVRLKTARVPVKGKSQAVGELVSIDGDEAVRLVESGQADAVDEDKYAAVKAEYDKVQEELRQHQATAAAEAEAISLRRQAEELIARANELAPTEEGGE